MEYVTVGSPASTQAVALPGLSKETSPRLSRSEWQMRYRLWFPVSSGWALGWKNGRYCQGCDWLDDFAEEDLIKIGARQYALTRLFDIHTQQLTDPMEQWESWSRIVGSRSYHHGPLQGKVAYEGNSDKLFDVDLPAYWEAARLTEDRASPLWRPERSGIDDIAGDIAKQHL